MRKSTERFRSVLFLSNYKRVVILSERSESKDLRTTVTALQKSSAKILRLRALRSAQDDSFFQSL